MSQNQFRDRLSEPPHRNWFFQPPGAERVIQADSLALLARSCSPFYEQFPEDFRAQVEDYMCDYLPTGYCHRKGKFAGVTLRQVLSFTEFMGRTLLKKYTSGDPVYVEKDEAARRARICKECPHRAPSFCSSCLGISDKVMGMLPADRHTEDNGRLGACTKCGCLLEAKINFKTEVLEPLTQKRPEYPSFCWMNDER